MRGVQQGFFYSLLDPEYFESLDRYRPRRELLDIVESATGPAWDIQPGGFWTNCTPADAVIGDQGWKIHISAVEQTAVATLQRVLPVFVEERVPFKFCSDLVLVWLSTSKNWPRTGAGKFITIYPPDEEAFVRLIEKCYQATLGLSGPYILSDRPYRDSRVVFYRYGEHRRAPEVDAAGLSASQLTAPDGSSVSDVRRAYFALPSWIRDPFEPDVPVPAPASAEPVVLNNRYRVTGALRHSSVGGIYKAQDLATGAAVIVREARPMLSRQGDGADAQVLLEKEARILQKLGDTGYLPQFVDLFHEWEHLFLVQEQIAADSIWSRAIEWTHGAPVAAPLPPAGVLASLRAIVEKLARGLRLVHERGVVLRDLTKTNVLVTDDGAVKFIDLEFAYELDRDDAPVRGWTVGYASPQQLGDERPSPEDDYYALGALLLDILAFNASGYGLNPAGVLDTLSQLLGDIGLPQTVQDVVVGLLHPDRDQRWTPERAVAALNAIPSDLPAPALRVEDGVVVRATPSVALRHEVTQTVEGVADFILANADYARTDRLWPANPEVFTLNPLGIQYGAAGVMAFLARAGRRVPPEAFAWVRAALRTHPCPPSLYQGLGGVALVLDDLGEGELARDLLERASRSRAVHEVPGLYYGSAGWGLVNLHFWMRTREHTYLERALETADHLLRSARSDEQGVYWESHGRVPLGLGHGQSGIALFLTYANAACHDVQLLETAESALRFDVAQAERRQGRVHWLEHRGASTGPRLPHARYGTAGVGAAALRLFVATGNIEYRDLAEECRRTVSTRASNKLWQDYGLAGFGEFLLDMHVLLGGARYLDEAYHVATGILPNRIVRDTGFAFAGAEQVRISCDFGMGAAGIGAFLHRLLHPDVPRLLFADALLRERHPTAAGEREWRGDALEHRDLATVER